MTARVSYIWGRGSWGDETGNHGSETLSALVPKRSEIETSRAIAYGHLPPKFPVDLGLGFLLI